MTWYTWHDLIHMHTLKVLNSSQSKFPVGGHELQVLYLVRSCWWLMLLRERDYSWKIWTQIGWQCLGKWLHTHVHMGNISWISVLSKKEEKSERYLWQESIEKECGEVEGRMKSAIWIWSHLIKCILKTLKIMFKTNRSWTQVESKMLAHKG